MWQKIDGKSPIFHWGFHLLRLAIPENGNFKCILGFLADFSPSELGPSSTNIHLQNQTLCWTERMSPAVWVVVKRGSDPNPLWNMAASIFFSPKLHYMWRAPNSLSSRLYIILKDDRRLMGEITVHVQRRRCIYCLSTSPFSATVVPNRPTVGISCHVM